MQAKLGNRERLGYRLRQYWPAYLLLLPVVLWYLIFCYAPMGGLTIAFKKYSVMKGIWESPWIGLKNFNRLFSSPSFLQAVWNTLIFSGLNFVFGFPLPIIFAILLNEMPYLRFKKVVQTVSYLPHFISWSVAGGLVYMLLSPSTGAIAALVRAMGGTPQNYIGISRYFRPIVVVSDIWKNIGWSAIIYIAAISSVDEQLYEAALIDGAGRFARIWHVTLPGIRGTIGLLFIMGVGGLLSSGFEQMWLLRTPGNMSVADTLDVYVVRIGLQNGQFGYASAIGLIQGLVGLILVVTTNAVSKKFTEVGLW